MNIVKGKISIRQVFIIFILTISLPIIRVLPNYTSTIAGKASWITPIIAGIPFFILILVLNSFFKKHPKKSLDELFDIILGKFVSRVLIIIYAIWIFLLVSGYLRYFAERFLGSTLPYTPKEFFIIIMLGFVYVVVKNNIEFFARLAEILFLIFIIVFIGISLLLLPQINIENLYPVTFYDVGAVLKSIFPIFGIFTYITFIMFLGDKINHKDMMKKYGLQTTWFLILLGFLLTITTVGIFGHELVRQFPFPYFIALKNLQILDTVERIEAIFISSWVAVDFIGIGILMYVLIKLIKKIFNFKSSRVAITPIALFVYVFVFYAAATKFELDEFSMVIGPWVNVALGFVIPIIVWIIGKIRKKI